MGENFPKECNEFFNGSATVYGSGKQIAYRTTQRETFADCRLRFTAMTSSTSENSTFLYNGCTITNEEDNSTFHWATGSTLFTSHYTEEQEKILYANFTQIIIPVLTVFLPIADIEADASIQTISSMLTCPHINNINAGSMEPYPPPSPTPIGGSSSLSGGAIAGIVIGVLAAVGIVLGALWFFWFRKRRAARRANDLGDADHPPPAYTANAKTAEAPSENEQMPLTELSGQESQLRPELPTQKSAPRVELAGDAICKDAGEPPAELPAGLK